MRLTCRDLVADDVGRCFHSACGGTFYDIYKQGLSADALRAWIQLIEAGAITGDVLEDLDRPPQSRIVGVGAGAFVTDDFVREAESTMPPFMRAQLIERVLTGRSPVLTGRDVRSCKSPLNLVILTGTMEKPDLTSRELREVRNRGIEAGLARFRSYPLKSWLSEFYDPEQRAMFEASGLTVRRDYSEYFALHPPPAGLPKPFLVGVNREEVASRDGTIFSILFEHAPKRLCFSPAEQSLLRDALRGDTDEECAIHLDVSLSAVKKRWSGIYDRVAAADPNLLPDGSSESGDRLRSREKRRHLLNYLREHPQEIQPNVPSHSMGV